ncbi:uncharacterized protein N7515_005016 [Penicillium bovifimosum]|uniref:Zn(2)-C6 fungal-type domain-containing protein n=1 Tax=Penicillium bovifimosum TaxID=126998 RepID=A0A9W9L3W8_9EURO|nr:uncharacterized protein N7515_005016 [Penicillium bovifimosum]KAJ5135738.1 hypothetical protein N7515_005016 [Penicillium bovifimosum]
MSAERPQPSGSTSNPKRRRNEPKESEKGREEPKRHRVSRACDSCRFKKDKCDGGRPVCSTCAAISRPCAYNVNPKKRGLPTGYLRSLELLWGLVFQRIRGSEDLIRELMRSINLPDILLDKEAEKSDSLMASFKNSTALRDIEHILAILEQPEEERKRSLQAYAKGETPLDIDEIIASAGAQEWHVPENMKHQETPASGGSPPGAAMGVSPIPTPGPRQTGDSGGKTATPSDSVSPSFTFPSNLAEPRSTSMKRPLRLPENAWPLFDVYFSYTHCWFPILEKHDILRTAYQYTEADVCISCLAPGSGEHAALWAVLTLASLQDESMPADRSIDPQSNKQMSSSDMFMTARHFVPPESGPYDTGHVQALLILGLVKFGQQDWTSSWMLVGQAVRIARVLGLDEPQQLARAKHVFLGCFVLETLISESTSRCPSLRKADLAKIGHLTADGLEEWHPWEDQTKLRPTPSSRAPMQRGPIQALSTFNHLVDLLSILNELCCLKQDSTLSRAQLEQLKLQLQRWEAEIPKAYRVNLRSGIGKLAAPHTFGLEMTYESVAIALSSQIALREHDHNLLQTPHEIHATEGSKRLLQLLQAYLETYRLSTTTPILSMFLRFSLLQFTSRGTLSELDMKMQHGIGVISSQHSALWTVSDRQPASQVQPQRSTASCNSPTASQHMHASADRGMGMQPSLLIDTSPHTLPLTEVSQRGAHAASASTGTYIPMNWLTDAHTMDGVSLIRTPASLTTVGNAPQIPTEQALLSPPLAGGNPQRTSATSSSYHDTGLITEYPAPYHNTAQYQTAYQDPSLHVGHLVDRTGYGPSRRQLIAPDLDALLDELESLDGAEKTDNQPEFMQNLGFISAVGNSELYSFSGPIDPIFPSHSQGLPDNGAPSGMGPDSHS